MDHGLERPVPFERPAEFSERAELTPEEIAERAQGGLAASEERRQTRPLSEPVEPTIWFEVGKATSRRTSLVIDPTSGRIPATDARRADASDRPGTRLGFVGGSMGDGPFNGPEDLNLADRCITRGMPQTWQPSAYGNGFQIVQSPGYVALLYERLHEHRIIPLDERPQLHPASVRSSAIRADTETATRLSSK